LANSIEMGAGALITLMWFQFSGREQNGEVTGRENWFSAPEVFLSKQTLVRSLAAAMHCSLLANQMCSCQNKYGQQLLENVASSSGHSQILSRSRGERLGEGLGTLLCHGLEEMVDSVCTNQVHHFRSVT